MAKIKSYTFVGEEDVYDLEVDHPDHQFYTADGILTSNSHAIAYAIDSYFGAWLYTYYPEEWIATILQSENNSPKGLSKTINELKRLGYKIAPMDINHSGLEWTYSEEVEAFVPPLSSIKRVGTTAAREIMDTRPFRNLNDLLFDQDGKWYHSKMNKGSFDSLCKIEAFNSLQEFKDGTFDNHRQLYELLMDNWNTLRKGRKGMSDAAIRRLTKKGQRAEDILPEFIEQVKYVEDWTRTEKIGFNEDLRSAVNNDLFFPAGLLDKLEAKGIPPVTEIPGGETRIGWFLVRDLQERKTKKGKTYWRIRAQDGDNNLTWLKVWGNLQFEIPKYSVWLCEAKGDDKWGPSTTGWKIRPLELE